MGNDTELSYKRAAIEGASHIGLMIALFDTLARDLRRAASAIRTNDIELRCRELNHVSLVLGQLENWVDVENGGESAQTLSRFYAYLRARMMEAAATKSANLIESQIDMILHVRSAWQQLDSSPPRLDESRAEARTAKASAYLTSGPEKQFDRVPFSESA